MLAVIHAQGRCGGPSHCAWCDVEALAADAERWRTAAARAAERDPSVVVSARPVPTYHGTQPTGPPSPPTTSFSPPLAALDAEAAGAHEGDQIPELRLPTYADQTTRDGSRGPAPTHSRGAARSGRSTPRQPQSAREQPATGRSRHPAQRGRSRRRSPSTASTATSSTSSELRGSAGGRRRAASDADWPARKRRRLQAHRPDHHRAAQSTTRRGERSPHSRAARHRRKSRRATRDDIVVRDSRVELHSPASLARGVLDDVAAAAAQEEHAVQEMTIARGNTEWHRASHGTNDGADQLPGGTMDPAEWDEQWAARSGEFEQLSRSLAALLRHDPAYKGRISLEAARRLALQADELRGQRAMCYSLDKCPPGHAGSSASGLREIGIGATIWRLARRKALGPPLRRRRAEGPGPSRRAQHPTSA